MVATTQAGLIRRYFPTRRWSRALLCLGIVLFAFVGYTCRNLPTVIRLLICTRYDVRSIPFAKKHLHSRDVNIRTAAAQALGVIGTRAESAVPDLIKALDDESPSVASSAAWALGGIQMTNLDPEVLAALIKRLDHPDREVRRYSAYAISLGGPSASAAVPALMKTLDDPHVAFTAAQALGNIGKPARDSIPQLGVLLKSKNSADRVEAVVALFKLRPLPAEIVANVKGLLNDKEVLVYEQARVAITTIASSSPELDIR